MLHTNLIRGEWVRVDVGIPLSIRAVRLVRALQLLRLRFDAARSYAEARGAAASRPRGRTRGARLVPATALEWHQQMRRLDTLMLAPQRSLGARVMWRLTRAFARRQAGAPRPAAG